MAERRESVLAAAAPPAAVPVGFADRRRVGYRVGGADGAGVRVTRSVGERHSDGVGQLADHETVLGTDLLAGHPRILGVPEPHERDRRVPPANPLLDLSRDGAVPDDEPGPGDLAGLD